MRTARILSLLTCLVVTVVPLMTFDGLLVTDSPAWRLANHHPLSVLIPGLSLLLGLMLRDWLREAGWFSPETAAVIGGVAILLQLVSIVMLLFMVH